MGQLLHLIQITPLVMKLTLDESALALRLGPRLIHGSVSHRICRKQPLHQMMRSGIARLALTATKWSDGPTWFRCAACLTQSGPRRSSQMERAMRRFDIHASTRNQASACGGSVPGSVPAWPSRRALLLCRTASRRWSSLRRC